MVKVATRPLYPNLRGQRHLGHDDKVILRVGQRRQYEYGRLMEKEHRERPIINRERRGRKTFRRNYGRHVVRNSIYGNFDRIIRYLAQANYNLKPATGRWKAMTELLQRFLFTLPLGTVRPVYRTGVSLLSRGRFFIYLINKYISLSDICLTAHH